MHGQRRQLTGCSDNMKEVGGRGVHQDWGPMGPNRRVAGVGGSYVHRVEVFIKMGVTLCM